jgi:hypothetical protein
MDKAFCSSDPPGSPPKSSVRSWRCFVFLLWYVSTFLSLFSSDTPNATGSVSLRRHSMLGKVVCPMFGDRKICPDKWRRALSSSLCAQPNVSHVRDCILSSSLYAQPNVSHVRDCIWSSSLYAQPDVSHVRDCILSSSLYAQTNVSHVRDYIIFLAVRTAKCESRPWLYIIFLAVRTVKCESRPWLYIIFLAVRTAKCESRPWLYIQRRSADKKRSARAQERCYFFHCGSPVSIQDQSMWDLWRTKWHWDRFFTEYFGFPLSISFHQCSITWKNKKLIILLFIFITRVAQKALRLRCVRSVCCGVLLHKKVLLLRLICWTTSRLRMILARIMGAPTACAVFSVSLETESKYSRSRRDTLQCSHAHSTHRECC